MKLFPTINKSWTLFLDRDGVINKEKNNGYIQRWEEFQFYDDVLDALATLHKYFGVIVVVTNQRGVGKGLMSIEDLKKIHHNMLQKIIEAGGRIDKIYFCTDIDDTSINRKPNIGMALQAQSDFPYIDFKKSIMVGNTLNDMRFGRQLNMYTVFVDTTHPEIIAPHPLIDFHYSSLIEIANTIKTTSK